MSILIHRIEVEEDQKVTGELSSPTVPLSTTPEAAGPESTGAASKYRVLYVNDLWNPLIHSTYSSNYKCLFKLI